MKAPLYPDNRIMAILKQTDAGTPAPYLCREYGMDTAGVDKSIQNWRMQLPTGDCGIRKKPEIIGSKSLLLLSACELPAIIFL